MSLQTPHIQSRSSYRSEWRASSSNRNVSSPYSLAIPLRSQRRSTRECADVSTQAVDSLENTTDGATSSDIKFLQPPKKAVILTEKPTRPRSYTVGRASTSSSILSQDQPDSSDPREDEPLKPRINDHVLAFAVTFAIAVLLSIVIPLAAILPQRHIKPLPISVLMPFYIDPMQGSWERLYNTVVKYHDTHFTIVVNPSNGPGNFSWPPATYIDAIKKLNVYPNVRTLGYIDTAQGSALNVSVCAQIATYAGWKNVAGRLAMHGVYFDRTPWHDDERGVAQAYLRNVSATVRQTDGWAEPGGGLVVHNPGRVPDVGLMTYRPDLVVVYEGTYDEMPSRKKLHAQVAGVEGDRREFAMLVRSVPQGLSLGGLRKIMENVRRDVEWLYVTDLVDDEYVEYGSLLERWLSVAW